jgi:hypothetical protein
MKTTSRAERLRDVMRILGQYESIDTHGRPRNEVAYVALRLSCDYNEAERLVRDARTLALSEG